MNIFSASREAASLSKRYQGSKSQDGFIALTTVMIIAALIIIIGASMGYAGFFSRFNILDGEFKEMSLGLAEACAEIARVEIANNPGFTASNATYDVGNDMPQRTCKIVSVTGSYTVRTQGIEKNSYSNIEAVFNRTASDVTVTSWKEVP